LIQGAKRLLSALGGALAAFFGPQIHPHFERVQIPMPCFGRSIEIQLKLKRMYDFHNAAFSKILGCVVHATDV
jgi:hypothetical protein